ncbi:hypothetical protein RJT34_29953 [Clitoria ternatea]|uniref:Transposase MuDR plant domain-containing protein n=1 Tax=Clitoria ternatea TaxID=43366 RepID=A0AAN9ETQ6_CLITE
MLSGCLCVPSTFGNRPGKRRNSNFVQARDEIGRRMARVWSRRNRNVVTPFWSSSPHYTNINWDYPDEEQTPVGLDNEPDWRIGDDLYVGLQFASKVELQTALKQYAMKKHQTYVVGESKPTYLTVKCPNQVDGCPWRMRAILSKKTNAWVVSKWGGSHTCVNVELSQDHPKLDSEFICSCILGLVNQDPSVSISMIQERILGECGFKISYSKAWKAKQKAIVRVFGDWDESYALLPRWLSRMLQVAPGSTYHLTTSDYYVGTEVDPQFRTFKRVFWTFKQCVDAFAFCKPVIQVDGTFLYGKYRHTLLVATTQDGNNNVLPIAFAVVEGETLQAWTWFLAHIRIHVTTMPGICLISDRHQSIKSAVSNPQIGWQPPNAYHVFCIRHIASNFNNKFKNTRLKQELLKLGYTANKDVTMPKREGTSTMPKAEGTSTMPKAEGTSTSQHKIHPEKKELKQY